MDSVLITAVLQFLFFLHGSNSDMNDKLHTFCSCWTANIEREVNILEYTITIKDCPEIFPWEKYDRRYVTTFRVTINSFRNNVMCERKAEICKFRIPYPEVEFPDKHETFNTSIVPVCDLGCHCNPVARVITFYKHSSTTTAPVPPTTSSKIQSTAITVIISIVVAFGFGITVIVYAIWKRRKNASYGRTPVIQLALAMDDETRDQAFSEELIHINFGNHKTS